MSYAPTYTEIPATADSQNNLLTPRALRNRKPRRRSTLDHNSRNGSDPSPPIIVHCHLCWDWVWQRPQQFVSRLSRKHRVLFVETHPPDASLAAPLARFRTLDSFPNLTVLSLQFPAWYWHDGARIDRERRELVRQFIDGPAAGQFKHPIQWFYDPMAVPAFLGRMDEALVVYDCMDELSKFACAPPEIVEREVLLLESADVVFTGGRKLFEAKRPFNDHCHFYGCGVEGDHFGKARSRQTPVHPAIAQLPKPVFGYFGVVDERLDYGLLAALADAFPQGSVAMVGPVLKVEERALPRRPNLHWLGKRDYRELPSFCKGFDVCLMPFALNESTEYINPTKALEYMAAGRPIVSTAVADVVSNFGEAVQVARSAEEFIACCRRGAEAPQAEAIQAGLDLAARNSWDAVVAHLEQHVETALRNKRTSSAVA